MEVGHVGGGEAFSEAAASTEEDPPPQPPRRALSAWGGYLKERHGNAFSKKASEEWKALGDDGRLQFVEAAAADKVRFFYPSRAATHRLTLG